jgi:hypothetical protein
VWEKETGLDIKPPSNIGEAVLLSEIRAHLAVMKGDKIGFLEKHGIDPRVASAILGAPAFLSGLTDAEVALGTTLKAMKEADLGTGRKVEAMWRNLRRQIINRRDQLSL